MAASSSPSVKAFNKSTILLACALLLCLQFSEIMGHGGPGGGDSGSGTDLRGRKLILVKIWCVIILFGSTFAAGVSPYFLPWNGSFILLGTQFAGGVFLATALMHFLGDANTTFGDLTSKTYPFAFMLAAVGYLLTMLADSILCVLTSRPGEREAKVVEDENTPDEAEAAMDHNPMFVMKASFVGDTLLLILALCFHSIFEGIAVGVSATKADAWRNLWTISLHKVFAAIAMGIALLRMLPKRPFLTTVAYAFAFAISSPVGVGIGIAIDATTQGAVADWIFAISMSLACGVFIYVAINHLIAKGFKPLEKSYFDTPFFKFLAVLAGVAVISVVLIWD